MNFYFSAPLQNVFEELHHMVALFLGMAEQEIGDTLISTVAGPGGVREVDLRSMRFLRHLGVQPLYQCLGKSVSIHKYVFFFTALKMCHG